MASNWIWWSSVLLFFLTTTHIKAQIAPSNSLDDQCDCGYHDPSSPDIWTNGWFMNFDNDITTMDIASLPRPPTTTFSHLQHDFFMASYEIAAKYQDTYSRVFSMDNVKLTNNALQLAVTVNHNNDTNDDVKCAAIGTKRQDILFGSFRSQMRLTPINGTVQAMYFYNPNGEIDIEVLGAVDPPQAYFALHPGLQEPDGRASALTHDNHLLGFDPTADFHEYRFDWMPDRAAFYIDQVLSQTLVTHIPQTPGRFMFSHWTDGNAKFSKGPPSQDAFMQVKSLVALFNTSTSGSMPCQRTQLACNIQDILNGQVPASTVPASTMVPSSTGVMESPTVVSQSSPTVSGADTHKSSQSFLVGLLFLIGCTIIFF